MLGAILAMAVVIDLGPSTDIAGLVEQLGASRYASRIAAEGKLVGLGRMSLPALRVGAASKDAEIRARSAALLERIEGASLIEPTRSGSTFARPLLPKRSTKSTASPVSGSRWSRSRARRRLIGGSRFRSAIR